MSLDDSEVRHLAVSLLTAPTARDRQQRIGASNLSNGCDFCLASNLVGDFRDTPMLDRAYGGRVLGTAIHSVMEDRMRAAVDDASNRDRFLKADISEALAELGHRFPDALIEHHIRLGVLGGYGPVGSTTDLVLPSELHALDWKGTTKAKAALLCDFLAIQRGEPAPYGRLHKVHKEKPLSEAAYAKELAKLEYKITGYYGQLQMYGFGLNRSGIRITRLSNVFISRDDTMWFDNPASDGYDDPKRMHGVNVLSFDYDESYALALWQRGLTIWEALENGATPADFAHNEHCFPCSLDSRDAAKADAEPIVAVEVTQDFAAA